VKAIVEIEIDMMQDKELPWALPSKSFSINVDGLKNFLGDSQVRRFECQQNCCAFC